MNPEPSTLEPNHADRAHAEFGPSSLKHVKKCAGYQGKPGGNAASEKGTRIHEALEIRDPSALLDEDEVRIYDRLLQEEIETFNMLFGGTDGVTIHREERLVLELDCQTPTFGTSDIVAFKGNIGLGLDYKTGISKIDEVRENMQAKAYTLAMFQRYDFLDEIHFVFLVPQRDEILVGVFNRSEVQELRDEISAVIRKAELTRPKWAHNEISIDDVNPSVNCRFCLHEDRCPGLGHVSLEVARRYRPDLVLPDSSPASHDLDDPAELEKWLVIAKIVEPWASGIKHKATQLALSGAEFENFKLRSMGALKKTKEKNYLAQLAMRHGLTLEEVIEAADLSLNQLAKVVHDKAARGKKSAAVEAFEKEAIDLDLVEVGETRYTLATK